MGDHALESSLRVVWAFELGEKYLWLMDYEGG